MKSIETQGKTVDQAIEIGLYKLEAKREDVKITILEEAGLFNKARVRISLNTSSEAEQQLKDVVEKLTKLMGLEVDVFVEEQEENFFVDVTGTDAAIFIGKRGDNLEGFQFLINSIVNNGKKAPEYKRIVIDSDNYKQKREETLKILASRTASKVVATNRSIKLEPMNANERRIIHSALSEHSKVSTVSNGKEPFRYVTVLLKDTDKRKQKHDQRVAEQTLTTDFTNIEIAEVRPNND